MNIRDDNGLIVGVQHVFKTPYAIDWRRMISKENVIPNPRLFSSKSKEDLSKMDVLTLPDEQLVIKLQGFREVAQLRGYSKVEHKVLANDRLYVSVATTIKWLPNFETDGKEVEFTALADAHPDNTVNIYRCFLTSIAENRGFVRAVRGFLNIPILGQDEIGERDKTPIESVGQEIPDMLNPVKILIDLMNEKGYTFEDIQKKMVKSGDFPCSESYTSLEQIPKDQMLNVIERLKASKQKV